VVEGEAVRITDDNVLMGLAEVWATRWDGRFRFEVRGGCFHHGDDDEFPVFVFSITPAKVLAFTRGPRSGHTTHRF
jgi:hypothetical protein